MATFPPPEPQCPQIVALAAAGDRLDIRSRTMSPAPTNMRFSVYEFAVTRLDGTAATLSDYRSRVLLIVNVASKCGFTPQYQGLEALYRKHREAGVSVLAFPCNQFGGQEPGSPKEIQQFCSTQYEVSFPLFARIDVNGEGAHPLYRWLKTQAKGLLGTESIKWNFTKFLLDRHGNVVARFAPATTAQQIEPDILKLLNEPA
jgi:glutathione peroxidase